MEYYPVLVCDRFRWYFWSRARIGTTEVCLLARAAYRFYLFDYRRGTRPFRYHHSHLSLLSFGVARFAHGDEGAGLVLVHARRRIDSDDRISSFSKYRSRDRLAAGYGRDVASRQLRRHIDDRQS